MIQDRLALNEGLLLLENPGPTGFAAVAQQPFLAEAEHVEQGEQADIDACQHEEHEEAFTPADDVLEHHP